jgi:hypothetical protein
MMLLNMADKCSAALINELLWIYFDQSIAIIPFQVDYNCSSYNETHAPAVRQNFQRQHIVGNNCVVHNRRAPFGPHCATDRSVRNRSH